MKILCPKCKAEMVYFKENHWGIKLQGLRCPVHDIFMDVCEYVEE